MASPPSHTSLSIVPPASAALAKPGAGRPLAGFKTAVAPAAGASIPAAVPEGAEFTQVSLADVIRYLRKRWRLSLFLALPAAALVFAWLGLGEKVYEAEARLLLRIQDANVFNFTEMSHSGSSEISAPMLVNNHRAELQARSYLEYLYAQLPAADRDALVAAARAPKPKSWLDFLHSSPAPVAGADPREVFIKNLTESTRVEPLKDSHILRVLVREHDPALAARLANAYVQDYIGYVTQQELSGSKAESDYLQKKEEELRQRLQESEKSLSSYRQSESLVDPSDNREISGEKTRLLTQALAAMEVRLTSARQNMETLRQAMSAGRELLQIRLVGDNPDVSATHKLIEAAQAELADMRVLRGAKHPRVLEMNKKIETLRLQLQQSIESVVSMVTAEEVNDQREVEDLRSQLDKARKDLLAQGGKNVQQNLLRDQVAIDRDLYQKIAMRMTQAHLTGDFKDNGELRVADVAVPPEHPIKPSKSMALLAALMMFGLVFIGYPVGCGLFADLVLPLWRAEAPPSAPPAPAGDGRLPAGKETRGLSVVGPEQALAVSAQFPVLARLPDVPQATPPELLAALLSDPEGANHALGGLCRELVHQIGVRPGPRVLLILSAERLEGKTLVASTMAAYLATHGCRTLLMDCHPEAPAVHRWFHLATSHCSSASQLDELRYGNSLLYVLPADDLTRFDFSELVSGYTAWIGKAQHQVDWIVIDGPAILRSFAEALHLLRLATDIVMVHDPDRTTEAEMKASLNLLHPGVDPSLFRGLVLNRQRA